MQIDKNLRNMDAVFFDLDDLLIDSRSHRVNAIRATLDDIGVRVSDGKSDEDLLSKSTAEETMRHAGVPQAQIEAACEALRKKLRTLPPKNIKLHDGAYDLLHRLKLDGVTLGVISNMPQEAIFPILQDLGIDGFIDIIVGEHTLPNGKILNKTSEPKAFFEVAYKQLPSKEPTYSIMYVGDRPSDVRFGHINGCFTVFIPSNVNDEWPHDVVPPHLQVTSLSELIDRYSSVEPKRQAAKLKFPHEAWPYFQKLKLAPENIAGLLYFGGNAFLVGAPAIDLMGRTAGVINISGCTVATLCGPKSWGYSLAQGLGAAGAIATILSNATANNITLTFALAAQACVQTLAALNYPIERLKPYLPQEFIGIADFYGRNIRLVVGSSLIGLKVPTILAAAYGAVTHGKNIEVLCANLTWAAGDILFHRLYQNPIVKKGLLKLGLN